MRGRGLEVREAAGLDTVRGDLAGPDADRAAALTTAAAGARAVWLARGGYGAARLLPRLSLDGLASGAAVLGFSDSTALLVPLAARGGRALHAPLVETLGRGIDAATERALDDLVFGAGTHRLSFCARPFGRPTGPIEGRIVAGNLSVMASLCGTPWAPRAAGAVLFVEEVNEPTYRLDRALTQILQAGVLDGARGIVVGSLEGCGPRPPEGPAATVEEVLDDLAGRTGLPVVAGFPFGHGASTGVLPLGGRARIEGGEAVLSSP